METTILIALNFKVRLQSSEIYSSVYVSTLPQLCAPLSLQFMTLFALEAELSPRACVLAQYLLELTLQEQLFRTARGSRTAAASVHLASLATGGPGWVRPVLYRVNW